MKPGPKPDTKTKQINIRVEPEMYSDIEKKSKTEHRNITEIIRGLLVDWLKK